MTTRSFYRLDEISDITRLTKGDILNAVERQELALCAWVAGKKFGLVSKTNALLGLFDYNGTVSLTKQQSQTLLCDGKSIRLERFLIQEPERIKAIIDCRAQFVDLPNRIFSKLLYFSDVPKSPFVASSTVCDAADHSALLGIMKEEQPKWAKHENPFHGLGQVFDLVTNPPVKQLGVQPIGIKPEQLRLDIRKLTEYFGIECLKEPERLALTNQTYLPSRQKTNQTPMLIKPNIETNPIKVMIHAVLDNDPDFGSKDIWNILKQDVLSDERHFDVESIIDEMTNNEIIRFGDGVDTQIATGKPRFRTLVSEVKKSRRK
ncbi:MAG: hypothetical protein V7735_05360 [Photobacterium frigidiphilum]|uniref:hypothetical protein n=1 Tax=Photobacterium frigidiphilum TaxID=264736 RepID=UPI0030011236